MCFTLFPHILWYLLFIIFSQKKNNNNIETHQRKRISQNIFFYIFFFLQFYFFLSLILFHLMINCWGGLALLRKPSWKNMKRKSIKLKYICSACGPLLIFFLFWFYLVRLLLLYPSGCNRKIYKCFWVETKIKIMLTLLASFTTNSKYNWFHSCVAFDDVFYFFISFSDW